MISYRITIYKIALIIKKLDRNLYFVKFKLFIFIQIKVYPTRSNISNQFCVCVRGVYSSSNNMIISFLFPLKIIIIMTFGYIHL
jgi:E3 ubiquitin-protein ligase DOA10